MVSSRTFALPVLLMLFGACVPSPAPNVWEPKEPGFAPAGSAVALHGQLMVAATESVGPDGSPIVVRQLVDQSGVPTVLKGVSSMWLNWETAPFAQNKKGLEFMRDNWGISVVRAAMGVDADLGYLTNANGMLAKVEAIIQNAIDLGVYVLVDWHSHKAVDYQERSIAFFTDLALRYGAYPNVIWEPFNEPAGYTWAQIKPYNQAIVDTIRAIDPDNPIVLGTPTWSQDVDQAALDPVVGTNLLYTLHFYSCTHGQFLRTKANTALAAGLALMITEFGATFADGGTPGKGNDFVCEDETNVWFAWMAQNKISGVAWKLDTCADSSCILKTGASVSGPWPDSLLSSDVGGALYDKPLQVSGTAIRGGHGQFVVGWLKQP